MTALGPDHFPVFFKAVHGYDPFPWQTRLAKEVVETGRWPTLLDLPTGMGKTAAIDIGVFHLACEAHRGPERRAPLRILFVIDRRIVVDAAAEQAKRIRAALHSSDLRSRHPVLAEVARMLSLLSGNEAHPLDVVRLRGGAPQERDWARSPVQPLVVVSTVDQVGSRLLFRGYGVSPRMWPVHAGLVGADALWLLDEVHLSRPLEQTLMAIEEGHPGGGRSGVLAEQPRLAPFAFVRLSATPGEKDANAFSLSHEDRLNPMLQRTACCAQDCNFRADRPGRGGGIRRSCHGIARINRKNLLEEGAQEADRRSRQGSDATATDADSRCGQPSRPGPEDLRTNSQRRSKAPRKAIQTKPMSYCSPVACGHSIVTGSSTN